MVQDKWLDNNKLSEQFMDNLKSEDKLDNYNGQIDFQTRQNLCDKFLENSNIDNRKGIYCGDIGFKPDGRQGHLVVEYIYYNPKIKKYEYTWRIFFKNKKGKSLWEDVGEIDPEYVQEKSFPEFTKNINKNVDEQIKEDTKLAIDNSEEYIQKLIDFYQDNYPPEKDEEDKFKDFEKMYGVLLSNLKRLGGDISEYPKSLEDLIK
jgi:hypothetical protein